MTEPSDFDEIELFRAIARSGARALLIGRRALVLLGLPVLTADYDFWIDIDHISRFNEAAAPFGLQPSRSPEDARRTGRYVLENGEHVDVLVARSVPTIDGTTVTFEGLWTDRRVIALAGDVSIAVPDLGGLILEAHRRASEGPRGHPPPRGASRRGGAMTPSRFTPLAARLQAEAERRLSPEDARAYLAAPVGEHEREDILSLVRWFRRRYPTPADRLAYVRRAYARWQRAHVGE